MKLNIGSGGLTKPGFIGLDLYAKNVEIKADCDNTGCISESVEFIYTSHMIEHLTIDKFKSALNHWYDILKPGGYLLINCPNASVYIWEWLGNNKNENYDKMLNWSLRNLVGWEGHGTGMLNRILFTDKLLIYFINKFSKFNILHCFITETRVKNKNHIEYRKDGDLRLLAMKNDNNKFELIKAEFKHCKYVYKIRNNPLVRCNLIDKVEINYKNHINYYKNSYLKDDNYIIWLLIYDKKYIGYADIKVNIDNKILELGFKILPEFHDIKGGSYLISNMINRYQYLFEDFNIILTVYDDNVRAIKAYEKYGFCIYKKDDNLLTMKLKR